MLYLEIALAIVGQLTGVALILAVVTGRWIPQAHAGTYLLIAAFALGGIANLISAFPDVSIPLLLAGEGLLLAAFALFFGLLKRRQLGDD